MTAQNNNNNDNPSKNIGEKEKSGFLSSFRSKISSKSTVTSVLEKEPEKEKKEETVIPVGVVGHASLLSTNPRFTVNIPVSNSILSMAERADNIMSGIELTTKRIQESGFDTQCKRISGLVEKVTSKLTSLVDESVNLFTSMDMVFEVTTGLASLVGMVSAPLTPMSILGGVYTIYKIIKSIILKFPTFMRTLIFGKHWLEGTEQEVEMEELADMAVAEAGGSLLNLAYTGLIMILPKRIRDLLDHFQKYTRIKILEDLDWVFQIGEIVLSIPTFVLRYISGLCADSQSTVSQSVKYYVDLLLEKYEGALKFLPEITTYRLLNRFTATTSELVVNRKLLCSRKYLDQLSKLVTEGREHAAVLRATKNQVPNNYQSMLTELENQLRSGVFMIQSSHPEPVAILLYSTPGKGKTTFVQQCRQYLTGAGKNSIYDYTPTDGYSDFHDQYKAHNVWIHEDIGQRGPRDWAQYINHIGVNPSRMDGASLPSKSTIYFDSQLILGTTNKRIHRSKLVPVKDCGWEDPEAVERRWIVVEYERNKDACDMYRYDVVEHRWKLLQQKMNCDSAKIFCDTIKAMYLQNVNTYKKLIASDNKIGAADYCLSDVRSEGRRIATAIVEDAQTEPKVLEPSAETIVDRQSIVHKCGKLELLDMSPRAQQSYIDEGLLINGGTELVGEGEIHIGTEESWKEYVIRRTSEIKDSFLDQVNKLKDTILEVNDKVREIVPLKYLIAGGAATGLALLASIGAAIYFSRKSEDDVSLYQPFIHWASVDKKLSAKELYGEASWKTNIIMDEHPTEAVRSVAKNVLRSVFSYQRTHITGHIVMINFDIAICPAHFLLNEKEVPKEVFIRSEDKDGREVIAAFFTVIKMELEEDLAILKYKNPHVHLFRTLHRAINKEPSSRAIYLTTNDGSIFVGEPSLMHVKTGAYRHDHHRFVMKECIEHNYGGQVMSSPGLCGALAVTTDGKVIGWHIAGLDGVGYIRFWNKETQQLVTGAEDSTHIVPIRETEILGAHIVDDTTYHHVVLKSELQPSAMLEYMKQSPYLCPNGELERVPAVLGGKKEVNGEIVRTYDYSRVKNLRKVDMPVNMEALEFAKKYVHKLLNNATHGKKIDRLQDDEIVTGYRDESGVLRKVNLDASAGIPWNGRVGDYIDLENKKIDKRVLEAMLKVESDAKRNIKTHSSIVFKDANKDEIRNAEKKDSPRCFAAGPLHFTLLIRRWFGRLHSLFMNMRHETGIMIGINATSSEWHRLWKRLCQFEQWFDGDYEMWDGAMRKEFQECLNEELAMVCSDYKVGIHLLSYISETTRAGMDFTYVTTHSVPSGHGMTALYNSLINKMYVAYAWYLLVGKASNTSHDVMLIQIDRDLYTPVYGDDIVAGVSNRIANKFNAITYGMVMRDLGLGFTSADKRAQDRPFRALRDITFLKRHFYAHRLLGQIVGPLELRVLKSSAGYVRDISRDATITKDKLDSIQRELFLHSPEVYRVYWGELQDCYQKAFDMPLQGLTELEMTTLYKNGCLRSDLFEAIAEGLPSRRRRKRRLCRFDTS